MVNGIQGKVVVVSGASRGIGKAIAFAFASEGARLALCARDDQALEHTATEIHSQTHADILALKANLTKVSDIRRFVAATVKKFGRVDILINNAGGAHVGGISETTDEEWEYHLQLKLLGTIRMSREVIPSMTGGGGRIINIVGMAGKEPIPLMMVPGVTNGAILNFSKSLAHEVEKLGILVNCINPATTDTPLTVETMAKIATARQKSPEELRATMTASMPQGRFVTPEEIAQVALFLASDASRFISGTSINVDAGKSSGLW
jgi:NAD(P)-dependent dehydrogenase (short-subunit alcohol dehydrogenase family)